MRQRNLPLDVVFPVADAGTPGARNAFRLGDKDLYDAVSARTPGDEEFGRIDLALANKFGFEIPPRSSGTRLPRNNAPRFPQRPETIAADRGLTNCDPAGAAAGSRCSIMVRCGITFRFLLQVYRSRL